MLGGLPDLPDVLIRAAFGAKTAGREFAGRVRMYGRSRNRRAHAIGRMSAIFISHSSRDDAVAAELRDRLAEQGHKSVFLDFDPAIGIPAGRDWERELYRRLRACQAVIVLCSEHSMASRWCFVEIAHAKAFGKHIFPLKVAECAVDSSLTSRQVLDLTGGREDAYQRLWRGLEVAGLDPRNAFDWDGTRPPYPGLLAFQEADAAVFFGRDREIHRGLELLNRLQRFGGARAVLVLGASGSGKSSLVRAGILPRLRNNREEWLVVTPFRPLGRPLRELATALAETSGEHGRRPDWREIHSRLRRAAATDAGRGDALNDLARDLRLAAGQARATVLLVIDQAEELVAYGGGGESELFLPLLRAALEAEHSAVMTILTLRSDLLGVFQKHPAVRGFEIEDLRIGPISTEGVAQVIEGPAEVAGLELEPGLAQAMVEDTETDDALPMLAFTLRELYELYQRRGRDRLEIADYRDTLGGLAGSVARAAEAVYDAAALSEDRRQELRHSFLALATITRQRQYARQPASWATLPAGVHDVLERFVAARLLSSRQEGDERVLEVAHEAIFRSWARLREWLEEDREFLLWRRRLDNACREWQRAGRDPGSLLQGPALAEARGWLEREGDRLRDDERELVCASVAAARRRRLRAVTLLATTFVFLVAVAAGGITLWRMAESQRARAEDLGRVALAGDWLDDDPTRAALALLDLENPAAVDGATALMSAALGQTLAYVELAGHQAGLRLAEFDATGDRLLTASADGTARIWAVDGTLLATLEGHRDRLTAASFSPGGERVVTASADGTARVWSAGGTLLALLEGHRDRVTAVSFSADGERVVTASADGTARVWPADGGGEPILLAGHDAGLTAASFSAGGGRVVTASKDATARIWRLGEAAEPIVLAGHLGPLSAASFSADGERVVTASADGTARVWRADGNGEPILLSGHDDALSWAAFDRSGGRVVTASEDSTARVWPADGAGEPLIFSGHDDALTWAAFNRTGDRVVTASEDETARVWTADREAELVALKGHRATVARAAFSPDGLRVVTASMDGTARVWRADGEVDSAVVLEDRENRVVAARFSPDGERVATGLQDHALWVWNADGSCPRRLGRHRDAIRSLAWNADGDRLVSAAEDGEVRIWHADGAGEPLTLPDADRKATAAALSPLGNRVAVVSEDGQVRVWYAGGISEPVVFTAHDDVIEAVGFSPDGERIVTASQDLTARVHPVDGSAAPVVLGPHRGWVMAAAFGPLGQRVVTVSADRRTRVWRADGTGRPVVLNEHSVSAGTVAFSRDGDRLATVRNGDTVRIWNADGSGRPLLFEGDGQEVLALVFSESGERLLTVAEDGRVEESLLSSEDLLRAIDAATRVCLEPGERQRFLRESPEEALRSYRECERSAGRAAGR